MIEFVPSTICQKLVVGQQSNSFKKKTKRKDEIQMYLGLNVELLFFLTQN